MTGQLKHRWSIGHNYLSGISFGDWCRLLRANQFSVDSAYAHRAIVITGLSMVNSILRWAEERRFGERVQRTEIAEPPIFILGHWRSGTTHLHNLLSVDQRQFGFPNTYQVVNPHTFLSTEAANTRMFGFLLPSKRPMDNMQLSFESPQEDEFAILLSCFRSLYLGITFPRREQFYGKYLSFEGVPPEEVAEWKSSLVWFVKKLTLKYQRPIVLKSPPHTARIRLILETFPRARFIHIHRHPYRVFQSTRHYFDTAVWYSYLQRPDRAVVNSGIIQRYHTLHESLFRHQSLIPDGQLLELSFESLEQDPLNEVERIYKHFRLRSFSEVRDKVIAYLRSISGYQKNAFAELSCDERQLVAAAWRECFDVWGYSA